MIKNLNVLLVEDDDVAAESVIRSLKKVVPEVPVINARHGREALEMISDSEKIQSPYIVLLDLNMPVMDGFEFLEEVRSTPALSHAVIFVLTTSNDDRDRTQAYHHHVAGYMVKSAVGPQFSKLAHFLRSYKDAVELGS